MPARTALLVGCGRFPEEPDLGGLAGPPNDVQRLAEILGDPRIGGFEVEQFIDVEHHRLLPKLESKLGAAGRDDLILIYYSGHGKLDFRGQLCLATLNTRLDVLQSTSVPLPTLRSLIDSSKSSRIVLILDCCFSGAAGKAFTSLRGTVEDQLLITQNEVAGLHILTSATSIQTSLERERGTGTEVLGEFTRCVIEGIKSGGAARPDGAITLDNLRNYLSGELRGQKPQYWGIATSGDIVLARNPVQAEQRRMESRRRRLTEWFTDGHLSSEIYKMAWKYLKAEAAPDSVLTRRLAELTRSALDDPAFDVTDFVEGWQAIAGVPAPPARRPPVRTTPAPTTAPPKAEVPASPPRKPSVEAVVPPKPLASEKPERNAPPAGAGLTSIRRAPRAEREAHEREAPGRVPTWDPRRLSMAVLVLSTASGLTGLTSYLLGPGGLLSRIIAQALFVSAMVYAFRLAGLAFRSSAIWILLLGGFAQWFLDPLSSWSNAWVVAVLIEGAAIGLALRSIRALVSWGAVAMVAALWGIGGVVSNWTMHMWFDVVPMGMLGGSLLAALAGGVTLLLVRPPGFTPAFGQVLQTLGTWVVAWFLTLVLGRLSSAYVNGYGYSLIGSISGLLFGALAGGAVFAVLARTVPGIAPVRAPN